MIKTPVARHAMFTSSFVDALGCFLDDNEMDDAAKRINMHDDLVGCLMLARDMFIANDLILPKTLETINDCLEKCK